MGYKETDNRLSYYEVAEMIIRETVQNKQLANMIINKYLNSVNIEKWVGDMTLMQDELGWDSGQVVRGYIEKNATNRYDSVLNQVLADSIEMETKPSKIKERIRWGYYEMTPYEQGVYRYQEEHNYTRNQLEKTYRRNEISRRNKGYKQSIIDKISASND